MITILRAICAVTVLAIAGAASGNAQADMEQTVKAFSAWQGRGQMFPTGEFRSTFVGSFTGMLYIETEKGPLDAGFMICPAVVDVDSRDGSQEVKGRCTIVARDSSRAFADLACKGVHLVGCDGTFTFTGGTERFAGITGGGPITVRSGMGEVAAGPGNVIEESASGIILWPKLTYKLSSAAAGQE
jgi:hypothetical protein